jgi:hypothetical protein
MSRLRLYDVAAVYEESCLIAFAINYFNILCSAVCYVNNWSIPSYRTNNKSVLGSYSEKSMVVAEIIGIDTSKYDITVDSYS